MPTFYTGMPAPDAVVKLEELWNAGSASIAAAAAAAVSETNAAASAVSAAASDADAKSRVGGFVFTFDSSTTDSDPGAGKIRLNNAALQSVTAAYVDNLEQGGADISAALDTLDDSTSSVKAIITLREGITSKIATYKVTGSVVDGTGYRKLTLTYSGGSTGSFTAPNFVGFGFALCGNAGSTSAAGSDKQVQFNDGGSMGASANFTWDKGTNTLTVAGTVSATGLSGSNTGDETTATIKAKLGITTLSGSNTGDETTATIKTKLSITTLSGSNTGDQTFTVTGDATASGSTSTLTVAVTKINGVSLAGLATGLLKNTTTTGVPSIAAAGTDYVAPGGALGTPSSGTLSSCTADGTDEVGFRNIPQNSKSAAYTTVLADKGKHIFHPASDANARTFTIDSNANVAYPLGTAITFINRSANAVTIAITSDTLTLSPAGTTGSRTLAQYGIATAIKIGTTEWIISGTNLT